MLALYHILIVDAASDPLELTNVKRLMYDMLYMDNGGITADSTQILRSYYDQLPQIFNPYKFELQKFVTNDSELQSLIDSQTGEETPVECKLLGLAWNRELDPLSTDKFSLDASANTKRKILQSIASNYDIFNFNGPLLNRARIFMHDLQCQPSLDWDTKLSSDQHREWRNISKQVNSSGRINIDRFVGRRNASYRLISFVDSSKIIFGCRDFSRGYNVWEAQFSVG